MHASASRIAAIQLELASEIAHGGGTNSKHAVYLCSEQEQILSAVFSTMKKRQRLQYVLHKVVAQLILKVKHTFQTAKQDSSKARLLKMQEQNMIRKCVFLVSALSVSLKF